MVFVIYLVCLKLHNLLKHLKDARILLKTAKEIADVVFLFIFEIRE